MHETSIAIGFLQSLSELAEKENAKKITKVRVRIGKLSGIVIESFQFAFDTLKEEYEKLKSAELLIEELPVKYKCNDCEMEFETDSVYFPECPKCGSINLSLISGEELEVVDVEIEV
ncbi:hydrogenase nickel incorporation protein hypA [Desulfurobacterium thermolithotrophum DSM 11699]|uniref:Hydrogenase maturation factor HypA n=1 Tax=Desulfurobacterium thermolithotrophum (strain DSM 11699 / BSA) TaxID=868864 RepID=F0S2P0_DESTD|nr:hydrogenase maturation nickel metallochaperone HypA [Desulfurobacterium thermolithotrophum]ADY73112.1 hydrogenase nickel incorporation protein hypA [Desulfurobacterium thermolithotrophum DSM 11699]